MLCVIVNQQRDRELAFEALERFGLADPESRDLARVQIMFFNPHHTHGLYGMTLEGDDVYFLAGWDRGLTFTQRYQFETALHMCGAPPDECGTIAP